MPEMEDTGVISNLNEIQENNSTPQEVKFSHKKWKALLKKQKRKIKRQNEAQMRDQKDEEEQKQKEESPSFQAKERQKKEIQQLEEERARAEKAYLDKLWMEKERLAQEEFERKKKWEENEKIRRETVEKKIREEWEERQKKEKEEKEKEDNKKKHQDSLLKQATANENKEEEPWHNPIASLLPGKEKETCPFFAKTGACRFGERCSRGHPQPDTSNTILMKGMYSHFELEQGLLDENDTDLILEYEEGELYNKFRDFYDDIVPEFKAVGKVTQVKVCCNYEPHLRGNVYVQYASEEEAYAAMVKMNGRYYGGKQISCEPVVIKSWKSAICGLFGRERCPKGRNCNFLHVFKNPRNEFWEYDKPQKNSYNRQVQSQRSHRYSRSPYRRSHHRHSYSRDRYLDDYRSKSKYRSRSRSKDRFSRSHSRRRKYSRSRSRSRSRRKSRERSSNRYSKRKRHSRSRSKERDRNEYSRSRSRSQSRGNSRERITYSLPKQKHSRSRSRSKSSRSSSRSPSRHSDKKKKHKHKKHKKHSRSDKTSVKAVSNGKLNTDLEISKEDCGEHSVCVEQEK